MFNKAKAKSLLGSGPVQYILKNAKTPEGLLSKAFETIGKYQSQIGFEVLAMRADVPPDPNKGEVELAVELGELGDTKTYELSWSRRNKKFTMDYDKKVPKLL